MIKPAFGQTYIQINEDLYATKARDATAKVFAFNREGHHSKYDVIRVLKIFYFLLSVDATLPQDN